MSEVRNQQKVTVSLTDVPYVAENLADNIEEFIVGLRQYFANFRGEEFSADAEESFRRILSLWNTFLQPVQEIWTSSAIISSDINEDIHVFIPWLREERGINGRHMCVGIKWTEENEDWIKAWLPRWNMFLQTRAGETLVTCWHVCLTIVGFIFYIADQGSDIGTSIYYACNGHWWRAIVTLALVYGSVSIHMVIKWINGQIHCTGSAAWLRYVASLLVNWPDVKLYGGLCLLEWKLYKSAAKSAHLVPEWHERKGNVAYLKLTEGVWEACPQAILQLCLLVPDLYDDWTWTDYLRIGGACISLCTAGAALVNLEKHRRIFNYTDMPLSELVVLHVWAVPVTVSRLLSVTLLMTMHPYEALAGVGLLLILRGVRWCRTVGVPRVLNKVINMCLNILLFFISPFNVTACITYRRLYHAIHFLANTAATLIWAFGTPLMSAHSVLYTAIICFNAVMFALGVLSWQLHEKYWPNSYFT